MCAFEQNAAETPGTPEVNKLGKSGAGDNDKGSKPNSLTLHTTHKH